MTRRLLLPLLLLLPGPAAAQLHPFNGRDRDRGHVMLHALAHDLKDHFWDPGMKGLPFDSMVAAADSEIDRSTGYGQMNGIIAKIFLALNDSHTRYWPPSGVNTVQLGWTPYAIGDSVYLSGVEPWAAVPPIGLRVGDRLIAVDGWAVERRRVIDLLYLRRYIQPREAMTLTVDHGDGVAHDIRVPVNVLQGRQYYDLSLLGGGADWYQLQREAEDRDSTWDSRFSEPAPGVLYWRLRSFAVSSGHIRAGLRRARGKSTLILDLRGNDGGYVSTLKALLDRLAHTDQVGDTLFVSNARGKREAEVVERASDGERWTGRLLVLVDAESKSAAEACADVVQRLGLGTLIGDRTPGFLTEASAWSHLTMEATSVAYAASIGIAELERPDGTRVEGVGVTPDEIVQPTGEDLSQRRDPALARALQIAGLPWDPVKAMQTFRFGEDVLDR